jgi:large subunit ribosomal protein L21
MAINRLSKEPAVQGANEDSKQDVPESTSSAGRSSQQSNAELSTTGVNSTSVKQGRASLRSGKKAVITTGGKQYLVTEGETLEVDLLKTDKPSVSFDALLLIDGEKTTVGTPIVAGASVTAEVVDPEVKGEKVLAIRYKPKKRVHKVRGHRQRHSVIKISKIQESKSIV